LKSILIGEDELTRKARLLLRNFLLGGLLAYPKAARPSQGCSMRLPQPPCSAVARRSAGPRGSATFAGPHPQAYSCPPETLAPRLMAAARGRRPLLQCAAAC
jgi:hypothetical protein